MLVTTRRQRHIVLALILFIAINYAAAKNPRDNFCRRYSHQTTVIDDKLYVDGGWVNLDGFQQDHINYPNTWLGYHDLDNLVSRNNELWPDLNISLSKNDSIPTVFGGVLWGDEVNKRFYLYGGEWTLGFAQEPYSLLSYDILYDKWDNFGVPQISPPPNIASFGSGVGISETGLGYYYGGWISNASMNGWTKSRTMSSDFYSYAYDTGEFTNPASPDDKPRAEGSLSWIPAGDASGLLVYMGGIVSPYDNDTIAPQPFDEIFVFDTQGNTWFTQKATGEIPQNRRQFCTDVAWAPDKSSFNIYLWGGLSAPPPYTNVTSYNDIYILTLPSFVWVKAFPDHHGNATLRAQDGHYSASCNMVKSMSQLLVIGGTYPDSEDCDSAVHSWAQHNFWTGTLNNEGDNKTYWALYNPNITTNVVPVDVYSVVGGDKDGGATRLSPKGGFDSGNEQLQVLLGRRPSNLERTPTRNIHGPTHTSQPSHTQAPLPSPKPKLSTGAIVGIAVGGAVVLALILFAWLRIGKGVVRRREERRQLQMAQMSHHHVGTSTVGASTAGAPTVISPQTSMGPWMGSNPGSPEFPPAASPQPPSELPAQHDIPTRDKKDAVSPVAGN